MEEFIAGQEELVGPLWSDQVAYVASQLRSSTAHVLYSPVSKYVLFFTRLSTLSPHPKSFHHENVDSTAEGDGAKSLGEANLQMLGKFATWIHSFHLKESFPPSTQKDSCKWVLARDFISHIASVRKLPKPLHFRMYPSGPLGGIPSLVYKLLSLEVEEYNKQHMRLT